MKKLTKKIKVQMTSKKSAYGYNRQIYHPGDVFDVEERLFRADFMVKVEEPKKPAKPPKEEPVEAVEEPTVTEGISDVVAATAAPKVRKRKV